MYKDLSQDKIYPNNHMSNLGNKSFKISLDLHKEIKS